MCQKYMVNVITGKINSIELSSCEFLICDLERVSGVVVAVVRYKCRQKATKALCGTMPMEF